MLRSFWNAISAIFSNIFTRKSNTPKAVIAKDNRKDNGWDKAIPMSTGISVPQVQQTHYPVEIPETVSKYSTLIYAYKKAWECYKEGNMSQGDIWLTYLYERASKIVEKSALSGGIERRSLGDNSINVRSCAKSYAEFCNMSYRQRKLGVGRYIAAHNRYIVCQSVIDSAYSCLSRLYLKMRHHIAQGSPMPLRKLVELGEKAQDKTIIAYLCGVASRMLSEDKWFKHRGDGEDTPIAQRKPVTLTDSMDQTDPRQLEAHDIFVEQETRAAIMSDIEAVLASKDQVMVSAWASRHANRRQGEHGKGRNEWWKEFGLGKNDAYDGTRIIQDEIKARLEDYPNHLLKEVVKEAVDTIANG
jgi:hypothetical protein